MTTHHEVEFRRQLKQTIKDAYLMNVEMTGPARALLPLEVRRETKRVLGLSEPEQQKYVRRLVRALLPGQGDPMEDREYELYAGTVLLNRDRLLEFVAPPSLADRVRSEPVARLGVLKHVADSSE
jgi:hypothetical protein